MGLVGYSFVLKSLHPYLTQIVVVLIFLSNSIPPRSMNHWLYSRFQLKFILRWTSSSFNDIFLIYLIIYPKKKYYDIGGWQYCNSIILFTTIHNGVWSNLHVVIILFVRLQNSHPIQIHSFMPTQSQLHLLLAGYSPSVFCHLPQEGVRQFVNYDSMDIFIVMMTSMTARSTFLQFFIRKRNMMITLFGLHSLFNSS